MLNMINITEILLCKYRDGQSIKQICKQLHHSKNTVRRYLRGYEEFVTNHPNKNICDINYRSLVEDYVLALHYSGPDIPRRVLTPDVAKSIDEHIQENISKQKLGLHKQIKLKEDIHKALVDSGYIISYSSVCKYITNTYGKSYTECFIKQYHELGRMAEFDWGEVKLYINGVLRKFRMATFALPGSTTRWGKLYQRENTISLQEAHTDYFRYLGGVPIEIVYDNMKTAVLFKDRKKQPTQGLLNLMNHYGFTHRFCNIAKGNEKGSVELSVKYLRQKAFSGTINELHFNSIEEANEHLLRVCELCNQKESNREALIQEKEALLPLHSDYQCSVLSRSIVDKFSTVCYDKTHYSVPDKYIDKTVELRIYSDSIRVYHDKHEICRHDRSYKPTWVIKIDHYLNTLKVKSGALKNSLALYQAPQRIRELYIEFFQDNAKELIELLLHLQNNNLNYTHLYEVIDDLRRSNITKLNGAIVKCRIESIFINPNTTSNDKAKSIEAEEVEKFTSLNISSIARLTSNIGCYGHN